MTTVGYGDIYPVTDGGRFVDTDILILHFLRSQIPTECLHARVLCVFGRFVAMLASFAGITLSSIGAGVCIEVLSVGRAECVECPKGSTKAQLWAS